MRRGLIRMLPVLLVVAALAVAGGLSAVQAQGPLAHSGAAVSQYGPSSGLAALAGGSTMTSGTNPYGQPPGNCAPLDSWCAYCTNHADSDMCAGFTPPQMVPASSVAGASPAPTGSSSAASPSPAGTAASGSTVATMQSASLGTYLVDGKGMTLYTLSADTSGVSTCASDCVQVWPPLLLASGSPTGGSGVTGALAVITRADGGRQVTYKGMPLYYFTGDAKPGDTKGNGLTDSWGSWAVVKP